MQSQHTDCFTTYQASQVCAPEAVQTDAVRQPTSLHAAAYMQLFEHAMTFEHSHLMGSAHACSRQYQSVCKTLHVKTITHITDLCLSLSKNTDAQV